MLQTWGDGFNCECIHGCGTVLDYQTVEADRIIPGGSYRRDNIQPSCRDCNLARSDHGDWTPDVIRMQAELQRMARAVAGMQV